MTRTLLLALRIAGLLLILAVGLPFFEAFARPAQIPAGNDSRSASTITLTEDRSIYPLGEEMDILLDRTRQLSIDQVSSTAYGGQFTPSRSEYPNLGITREAVWVRFKLQDRANPATTWRLVLDFLPISQVSLYRPQPDGSGFEAITTGWAYPLSSREIHHHLYVFELPFASPAEQVYYMRFTSDNAIRLSLSVVTREALAERTRRDYLRFGLFYGALLVMAGYNLFLFLSLRERGYLDFVLFLLAFLAGQATLDGLTSLYVWPNRVWWNLHSLVILFNLVGIVGLQFTATFLNTRSQLPAWHRLIRGTQALFILGCVLALVDYYLSLWLMILLLAAAMLQMVATSFFRLRQGFLPARFYLMGWTLLMISGFAIILNRTGVWQGSDLVEHGYTWSVALLVLLLSMALVDRINVLRREAESARREVAEHSLALEANVAARTRQLSATIQDLEEQIGLRRQVEEVLRESELRFRTLFENAPLGIAIAREGRFTYVNHAYGEMFGFEDASQLIGTLVGDRVAPQNQPTFFERARRRAQGMPVESRYELICVRRDGSQFPVMAAASLVQLAEGPVTIGFFQDISYRIQIEQAEREQRVLAEALRDSAASLNSTLEVEDVLDSILVNAGRVVAHNAANVMMIDAQGEARVVRYRSFQDRLYGEEIQKLRFPVAEVSSFRTMLETRQPLIITDTRAYPGWVQYDEIGWVGSYAGLPILQKGKVVGFINLDSDTPGFYTPDQIDRLRVFADQAAIALENAQLYRQAQQHARQMTSLYELGLSITAQLDQSQLILELVDKIKSLLNPHVFYVAIYDENTHEMAIPYFYDEGEERQIPARNLTETPGLSGEVLFNRRTLVIKDLHDPQQLAQHRVVQYHALINNRTYVGTPMLVRNHAIGLISIQSRQPDAYSVQQIQLLETIAAQAAVAIENSLLFERLQDELLQRRAAQASLEKANQQLQQQILQIEALQADLREQAIRDALTGLYNRRYLEETLSRELARASRESSSLGLIFMDIDHFKVTNDTYGHSAGDLVLQSLADLIRLNIRAEDIACRYGGEEFLISLPGVTTDILVQRAELIRAQFDTQPPVYQGRVVHATLSIGAALYPMHARDATHLVQCADHAMYQAKQAGRNRVVLYNN